jgi:hypothetical protein
MRRQQWEAGRMAATTGDGIICSRVRVEKLWETMDHDLGLVKPGRV